MRRGFILAAALMGGACAVDDALSPGVRPEIVASNVTPDAGNVISVRLNARVHGADSVAVRYGVAGESLDSVTPAVVPADSIALVPVFGLEPETLYVFRAVVFGGHDVVEGQNHALSTGPLPADLPQYVAGGPDPSPGYVVFAAGFYGIVIDNRGRVVWYHRFPHGPGLNFQAQPTGRYVAQPPPANEADPAAFVEIDPLGATTRRLGCAGGLVPRFHDLIAEIDGSYWILCDDTRTMDLGAFGGQAEARVTGSVVQHIGPDGGLRFQWSAFDHFEITDLDPAQRTGSIVNWTHANALDLDGYGNLLVSFRSLNEITKIDVATGQVIWRMGGRANQFHFHGSAQPAFAGQHGLRMLEQDQFFLLDNRGNPGGSAAELYAIDEPARLAFRLVSFEAKPPVTAQLGGTTQLLERGHLLVSYGSGGRVEEYDPSGKVAWSIDNPGYVFRAQRIASLYHPGTGLPR
jgi:Arylsulfotransferase (ASST)